LTRIIRSISYSLSDREMIEKLEAKLRRENSDLSKFIVTLLRNYCKALEGSKEAVENYNNEGKDISMLQITITLDSWIPIIDMSDDLEGMGKLMVSATTFRRHLDARWMDVKKNGSGSASANQPVSKKSKTKPQEFVEVDPFTLKDNRNTLL
jgi:hypothetical protein